MFTLSLEPTDDLARPEFRDAASCEQWLSKLQFTNLHAVHGKLRTQIDELNRYPMRALDRLNTLEQIRETVAIVQTDYAKKLIARKLPLSDEEFGILASITGLWKGMLTGYQRCLQEYMDGNNQLEKYSVLLCHRFMLYGSLQILEHLRSGYDFDGTLWQQLHALFSFTEGNGLQHEKVKDPLYGTPKGISCQNLYAKILLTCQAKPSELSRSQLQLLDRWLNTWTEAITFDRRYMTSKGDAPPLAVDLRGVNGLQILQHIVPSDHIRYLAMVPMSKLLRVKIILLQQGQDPRQLELGDEFFGVDCNVLLNHLLHQWCEGSSERSAERHSVAVEARICTGFEQAYECISGRPIKTGSTTYKNTGIDTSQHKQIAVLGHAFSEANLKGLEALESWTIENESILGAKLIRNNKTGERIGNNQLIALKTPDAKSFMLGSVSWRSVTLEGMLKMGLQYLPGAPQAVSIKIPDKTSDSSGQRNIAALMLPSLPNLRIPASLVLPREIFQPNFSCELTQEDKTKVWIKMGFSVLSGADFERVSFTVENKT